VFLSDAHIGGPAGSDIFESAAELTALLRDLNRHERPVELVLAGDFFDHRLSAASLLIRRYNLKSEVSSQPGYRRWIDVKAVVACNGRQALGSGSPSVEKISARSAKYRSNPPGEMISSKRTGSSVGFQNACGTPLGFTSMTPGPRLDNLPPDLGPDDTLEHYRVLIFVAVRMNRRAERPRCQRCSTTASRPSVRSSIVRSAGPATYWLPLDTASSSPLRPVSRSARYSSEPRQEPHTRTPL
jgi:hypothetical protein